MIIAIDGPAASGKGTIARRLSAHYGLPHLDTGLLYRGTAKAAVDGGTALDDEEALAALAGALNVADLDRSILSAHGIGDAASQVAALPKVREALLRLQHDFAAQEGGAILDGRDIGTFICPQADAKLFVTASAQVRANRRYLEAISKGEDVSEPDILATIERRDARDSARALAPMQAADDAHLIDTTKMDIETAVSFAIGVIEG